MRLSGSDRGVGEGNMASRQSSQQCRCRPLSGPPLFQQCLAPLSQRERFGASGVSLTSWNWTKATAYSDSIVDVKLLLLISVASHIMDRTRRQQPDSPPLKEWQQAAGAWWFVRLWSHPNCARPFDPACAFRGAAPNKLKAGVKVPKRQPKRCITGWRSRINRRDGGTAPSWPCIGGRCESIEQRFVGPVAGPRLEARQQSPICAAGLCNSKSAAFQQPSRWTFRRGLGGVLSLSPAAQAQTSLSVLRHSFKLLSMATRILSRLK